jgi:hypothetical protein
MIDLTTEQLLPLAAAAALLPPGRRGKKTHIGTLVRWIQNGVLLPSGERVRLEANRLGSRWLTSLQAIERFMAAQTPTPHDDAPAQRGRGACRRRQKASEEAAARLEQLGL